MYPIGSYAAPQILSVNPDLNLDSFVMPANDSKDGNTLNSGVDLQFCVMAECPNKEAAYEVLDFLFADENIQKYIDAQTAIPCKEGDFVLPSFWTDDRIHNKRKYERLSGPLLSFGNGSGRTNPDIPAE